MSLLRTCRQGSAPPTCSDWAGINQALVLGTGDLSELALGWMTYGVGVTILSHYNVNVSVPKTLIQYLLRWVIASGQFDRGYEHNNPGDHRYGDFT